MDVEIFDGEIIRKIIIPEFKAGSFYYGLDKGTTAIIDVLKGKYKGKRKANKKEGIPPIVLILIVVFVSVLLVSEFVYKKEPMQTQNAVADESNVNKCPSILIKKGNEMILYDDNKNQINSLNFELWSLNFACSQG